MNIKIINNFISYRNWINKVNKKTLKNDFFGGLSSALVVIPQGIAFSILAGLPPQFGLFTAIFPVLISAFFGSSLFLVSGPTTIISVLIFSSLNNFGFNGADSYIILVGLLTFLTGLIQFIIGIFKIGKIIDYISMSVLLGFTYGSAIIIIVSQFKNAFGLSFLSKGSILEVLYLIFKNFGKLNIYALLIFLMTIISSILIKKFFKNLPGLLISILLSLIIGNLFFINKIIFVTPINTGLPIINFNFFDYLLILKLFPYAILLAIVGLISTLSLSKQMAIKSNTKINTNQECVGQGLGNMFGSFFNSYISSGSVTRTAINFEAGAKTPISSIFSAGILFMILIFFYKIINLLPLASIAGVTILSGIKMLDYKKINSILINKNDKIIFWLTFLSAIIFSLEYSILIGILIQFVFYIFNGKNDYCTN